MKTIAAFEAKTRFGELLDRVIAGEEIVITRHEKPVARLIPEGGRRLKDVQRAVAGLKSLQKEIQEYCGNKRNISWQEFKNLLQESRR